MYKGMNKDTVTFTDEFTFAKKSCFDTPWWVKFVADLESDGRYIKKRIEGPSIAVKHILINGDYTTVVWKDGTSTVVKRTDGDEYDEEKAIMYAILKKLFGNNGSAMRKYIDGLKEKTIVKEPKKKSSKLQELLYVNKLHREKEKGED